MGKSRESLVSESESREVWLRLGEGNEAAGRMYLTRVLELSRMWTRTFLKRIPRDFEIDAAQYESDALQAVWRSVLSWDPKRGLTVEEWARLKVNYYLRSRQAAEVKRLRSQFSCITLEECRPEDCRFLTRPTLSEVAKSRLWEAVRSLPEPESTVIAIRFLAGWDRETFLSWVQVSEAELDAWERSGLARLREFLEVEGWGFEDF